MSRSRHNIRLSGGGADALRLRGAIDRLLQLFRVDRFQQVVHGARVERAHGVVRRGGREHDLDRAIDLVEQRESVETGQRHVEEDEIGTRLGDHLQRARTVLGFTDDLDLRMLGKQTSQPVA